MNYKLNANVGNNFSSVSKKASEIAKEKDVTVEFEFNGVTCLVDKNTNVEWLYRDYANSWTMEWKEVGPNCVDKYDKETQDEFERKTAIAEAKSAEEARQYKIKEDKERVDFSEKVKRVEIELKSKSDWEKGKATNIDDYGSCIYEYAEGWAKLMQAEIAAGNKLEMVAEKTSHELGFLGITGFMYGAAVSILSQCWVHGEQLRRWHNKEYNHEGEGVVNPAILTLTTSE